MVPVDNVLGRDFVHPRLPLEKQAQYRASGLWAGVTLADCVEDWATRQPDRVAVVGDRVLSYGEVWREACSLAAGLQRDGIEPGEYLLAILDNSWQGLVLEVAASLAGVVLTPRSPHISPAIAENLFIQLDIRGLVIQGQLLGREGWPETYRSMLARLAGRPVWYQGDEHELVADRPHLETLAAEESEPERVDVDPGAPSLVLATGGTTGIPKSILHGSEALVYAARHFAAAVDYTQDDVSIAFAPYGHAGGSIFDIYMPLLHGARVLPLRRWRAEEVGPLIKKWGGTFFVTMGTHVYDLMQQAAEYDENLASVRLVTSGAGPDQLFKDAQERFEFTFVRVYGCGECPGHAIGRPGDPEDARLLHDGVPFPGVEVRIVDPLTGQEVAEGAVGEYECRGPNLFMGYVGQDELTAELISPEGYYRSGDRMVRDTSGYITWSGRSKEIIRRGGLQIDPVEMEGMLSHLSGLASVVVVGEQDERLGERAVVVAMLEPGADVPALSDLCAFLVDQGLPRQSLPERLVVVEDLPRTELGKFHRARIKEQLNSGDTEHV